jgi:hypothetical protein
MYIKLYGTTPTPLADVNLPLLEEEARAAGAAGLNVVVGEDGQDYIAALYPAGSGAGNGDVDALIAAHNPAARTEGQKAADTLKAAEAEARAIPDFVTWDRATAEGWIQDNVNDLATAKAAQKKMAGNIAALNGRVFPDLRG